MNKDAVYYKITITNNDIYPIKNIYMDISTIIDDFDYKFNIYYTSGNIIKYSYVSNNYECYKYMDINNNPITFPQGNATSWMSTTNNTPNLICITLPNYLNPNSSVPILIYPSDIDNSIDGDYLFEFYASFNNAATFSSKFHSYSSSTYYLENGVLTLIPQPITVNNNILTSQNGFLFSASTPFQISTRWKIDNFHTTDSSYIGLIKTRSGLNYESSKYLYTTNNTNCKVINTIISNTGYNYTPWNHSILTFTNQYFKMLDGYYGSKNQVTAYSNFVNHYIGISHSIPNPAIINSNRIKYDFVAKTAFPIIQPTYTIAKKTKYYETYTSNKKTVISDPAINLSGIDNFQYIKILAEQSTNAYIRFAFSFNNKQSWCVYNSSNGVWDEISTDEIIVINNNNFDSINSKGMTPEFVGGISENQFQLAISQYGLSNFYIMACYKSDASNITVSRDLYEIDITKLYTEEFAVNSSFKKIELAYNGIITINNSSTGISYTDFPFKLNITGYLNINGENIRIVDMLTYEDIQFTYEYTGDFCHSSDIYALPEQTKTGFIWFKYSIAAGQTKQLLVLNNITNRANEGGDVFDKYCDFTKGIPDFFIVDDDANIDITTYGTTFNNKRGMYYTFTDTLEQAEYITEVSSAIGVTAGSNIQCGSRLMLSNIQSVPDSGTYLDFIVNLYSVSNPYATNLLLYTTSGTVQTSILTNTFEVYGIILNKQFNSISIYKNYELYKTGQYGNFMDGVDIIRLGYLNNEADHEEIITPTTYKWFRIRKTATALPSIGLYASYDTNALIKTNDDTNFKFNNDFFKSITNITCHENKPINTDIKYLFSFDNAETWCKWSTTEQIFTNGWKNKYVLTIDKNRVPSGGLTNYKLPIVISNSAGTNHQDITAVFNNLRCGQYYNFYDACTGTIANNWDIEIVPGSGVIAGSGCFVAYNNSKLCLNVVNNHTNVGVNALSTQTFDTTGESVLLMDWTPADDNSFPVDDGSLSYAMMSILPESDINYTTYGGIPNYDIPNKAFMGIKFRSGKSKILELHANINDSIDTDYNTMWEFPLDNNPLETYRIKLVINWNKYTLKLYINNKQINNIINFNPKIKPNIGGSFKVNFNWHCNYSSGVQQFSKILVYENNGSSPLGLRYYNDNMYKIRVTNQVDLSYPIEIVSFDCHNRNALILVTIPYISNINDTDIYLYYDANHKDNSDVILNSSYVFDNYEYIKSYQVVTSPVVIKRWAETPIDSIATSGNSSDVFNNVNTVDYSSNIISQDKIDLAICLLTSDTTKTPSIDGFDINCVYEKIDNIAKINGVGLYYTDAFRTYTPDVPNDIRFYKINTDDFAGFYSIRNVIGKIIFNY